MYRKGDDLINCEIGDEVYVDCLSSMGASSCGMEEVSNISFKYDEDTGEKYKIIHCGESTYDSRTGSDRKYGMFYLS